MAFPPISPTFQKKLENAASWSTHIRTLGNAGAEGDGTEQSWVLKGKGTEWCGLGVHCCRGQKLERSAVSCCRRVDADPSLTQFLKHAHRGPLGIHP